VAVFLFFLASFLSSSAISSNLPSGVRRENFLS
jgi:hypothetical protein